MPAVGNYIKKAEILISNYFVDDSQMVIEVLGREGGIWDG
jgi:hypothetical protein